MREIVGQMQQIYGQTCFKQKQVINEVIPMKIGNGQMPMRLNLKAGCPLVIMN
jgi:hypothetical protein